MATYETAAEAKAAWLASPEDDVSPDALEALGAWIRLCTDASEAGEACAQAPPDSDLEAAALAKWEELSLAAAKAATTAADAEHAFVDAPAGCPAQTATLEAWIRLCTKPAEASRAWCCTPGKSDLEAAALAKWEELSLAAATAATTKAEAKTALEEAPPNGGAAHVAQAKLDQLPAAG